MQGGSSALPSSEPSLSAVTLFLYVFVVMIVEHQEKSGKTDKTAAVTVLVRWRLSVHHHPLDEPPTHEASGFEATSELYWYGRAVRLTTSVPSSEFVVDVCGPGWVAPQVQQCDWQNEGAFLFEIVRVGPTSRVNVYVKETDRIHKQPHPHTDQAQAHMRTAWSGVKGMPATVRMHVQLRQHPCTPRLRKRK